MEHSRTSVRVAGVLIQLVLAVCTRLCNALAPLLFL